MSNLLHATLLGFLQGLTEFLPISSTAHLILLSKMMKWDDFGLAFDVFIHLGSLIAIIFYFIKNKDFRRELFIIHPCKLLWVTMIATIPVGISGLLFNNVITNSSRSIELISITTIVFGLILGFSYFYNRYKNNSFSIINLTTKSALLIGVAQAIAIIPGVSRSGITLTAGLFLGLNIVSASRFSFLLAIPVIFLAGAKQGLDLITYNQVVPNVSILISGFLSSMITSFISVFLFFKYINKVGVIPFIVYRVLLGVLLFITCIFKSF